MKKCALFSARWWLRVAAIVLVFSLASITYRVDLMLFTGNEHAVERDAMFSDRNTSNTLPLEHSHTHVHKHFAAVDSDDEFDETGALIANSQTIHRVEPEKAIAVVVTTGTIEIDKDEDDEDEEAEEKAKIYGEWPSTDKTRASTHDTDNSAPTNRNADNSSTANTNIDNSEAVDTRGNGVNSEQTDEDSEQRHDDAKEIAFKSKQYSGEMAAGVVVGMPEKEAVAEAKEMNEFRKAHAHRHNKGKKNKAKGTCHGTIAGDNELVITTYVAGLQYQDYIPLYIYFALLAYPDAFVAVYLQDSLHPDIGLKLDVIPSDRWCVHQTYKTKLSQSGHASLMRAFLNAEFLQQFKYQYVGDVDVFILRETPSLVKQHVQHMQMIGEPYSNVDRYVMGMPDKIDKGHKCRAADCHRVTGLHFFETKPYMARIKHAQAKWEGFLAQMGGKKMCSSILNVRKLAWCDETLLYRIITDSGMSVPTRQQWFRPHHGVHIRIYSKGRKAVPEYARQLEAVLHNHLEALVPYIYDHGNQSELALCISTFLQKENYDLYSEYRVYAQSKYKINISPTYIYRNEAVQVAAKRSRPKTNIPRKVRNRSLMKTSQRLEPRLYITST